MKTKQWIFVIALLIVGVPALFFAAGYTDLLPPSSINCWQMEMNVSDGQLRFTRMVFWKKSQQKLEETTISSILASQSPALPPDWRLITTFSADVTPSYKFISTGTLRQFSDLEALWKVGRFTPSAKTWICQHVLQTWRNEGLGQGTIRYIEKLGALAMSSLESGKEIDEATAQECARDLEKIKSPNLK